jgi:hypothetical protein
MSPEEVTFRVKDVSNSLLEVTRAEYEQRKTMAAATTPRCSPSRSTSQQQKHLICSNTR